MVATYRLKISDTCCDTLDKTSIEDATVSAIHVRYNRERILVSLRKTIISKSRVYKKKETLKPDKGQKYEVNVGGNELIVYLYLLFFRTFWHNAAVISLAQRTVNAALWVIVCGAAKHLMPCIQRQTSRSVRAEIQRKRRKDPCSLSLPATSPRDRSLNQRNYLFFFAHNDLAWSLHSTITRRIVWRSAERRLSMPIPGRIGHEGNVGAFCPLSQHRLRTCLSSWGIAGDKSSAASPFLPFPVGALPSTRERVTLRFRSRRCAPHTSRRSSHHCGTRDKGALNVLKTPRTGVCPLAQS